MASTKKTAKKKPISKKATSKKVSKKKAAKKATKKKASQVKQAKKVGTKKATNKKTSKKKSAKKKPTKRPSQPSTSKIDIGQKVPNFVADATQGPVKLSELSGKKVVIYFYPKDHTSGCTQEGHDFTKAIKSFKKKNAVIFGVSRDSLKSHENFIAKQAYKFDLISDPEEKLCHLFGVMKEKSMYGRKYVGVDRSTFVIDENGILSHEWRGVKVPGHVDAVLAAID